MAVKRRRPRAYHHGNLGPALLEAARVQVERRGASAVSLRDVARRAGVSHTAAYHHFDGREGLLQAVAARGYVELGEVLAAAAEAGDPDVALAAVGKAYVAFAVAHPRLFRLMFSPGAEGLAVAEETPHPAFEVLEGAMERTLGRRPVSAGRGAPPAHPLAAWSLVHGLSMLLIDEQLARHGFKPERWEAAVALVMQGAPSGTVQAGRAGDPASRRR